MLSGKFRHRVRIQSKAVVRGALGESQVWTTQETRWARVATATIQERNAFGREEYDQVGFSGVTHKIIFRGNVTLSYDTFRFVYKGKIFEMAGSPLDPEGLGCNTIVYARETPQNVES